MPDVDQIEFDDELEDDIEIEFEDDTPDEDKGRPKAPENSSDEEDDLPDDEELRSYNQSAQKRIRQLTKKFHDERRAKEAVARERDQAANFARTKLSEAELLRKQLTQVASGAVSVHKDKYTSEIAELKEKLARAVDEGNGKEVAELTDKIAEARENLKSTEVAESNIKRAEQEQPKADPNDPNDQSNWPAPRKKWASENSDWFGKDEEMTALAYAVHGKLVKEGVVPDTEEYFKKLTNRIQQVFPDKFKKEDDVEVEDEVEETPAPRKAAPKAAPVGPNSLVKMTVKNGKRIYRLTDSQRALCKRLGITPQQYIAEVGNLGNNDE